MIVETFAAQGDSDDCQNESRLPPLVPWTWSKIAPGVVHDEAEHAIGCGKRCQCGVLCQACAERRLGRKLAIGDFQASNAIALAWRGVAGRFRRVGDRVREVLQRYTPIRRASRRGLL